MRVQEVGSPEARSAAVAAILPHLPDWFGMPDSNAAYISGAAARPTWAAHDARGHLLGALVGQAHLGATLEVWWMGVLPPARRRGAGRALIAAARGWALERGLGRMAVSTLSARSPDPFYAETRAFYAAVGFRPLVEFNTDDPLNPMQWMVMDTPPPGPLDPRAGV